jgi:hypothetical protein
MIRSLAFGWVIGVRASAQRIRLLLGALVSPGLAVAVSAAEAVAFAPGEHIAIVGNALAHRMQHHGWLEAMIHAQHPAHRLVVRNLAFAGDEVALRPRSQDFGTPDEWLTRVQASVVFAFFGFSDVIAATKLVDPGHSETLRVDALITEGEYEYVCTFPGHWVTMWGRLIVASDPGAGLMSPEIASPPAAASKTVHQHDDE